MLRHTFCSHLAAAGVPAKAIQELAGHADLKTTLRYMHLSPGDRDGAMEVLARYHEGGAERGRGKVRAS
jgi:site-specific recombinase XerD